MHCFFTVVIVHSRTAWHCHCRFAVTSADMPGLTYHLCVQIMTDDASGKSAGIILRQIHPEALAQAKAVHLEETCSMLRQCSLQKQTPAPSATFLQPDDAQTSLERRKQSDSCQIRKVVNSMLKQVSSQD